jgi:methionyl-tRNA formyltransferase
MKDILFLGYKKKNTKIINYLNKCGFVITELGNRKLTNSILKKDFILIVSFGYKKILKKNLLKKLKRPVINLHMSYLPYNRGAYPNMWSFINNTPKGVSIHEIDSKIDNGPIIFRKKISFKNEQNQTLKSTYEILFEEIENLFIKNFYKILENKYKKIYNRKKISLNFKKDKPKKIKNWNIKIKNLKHYL